MMEKTIMRKIKLYWAWQDEEEEAWLRKMSQEGWHLSSIGIPTIYYFELGEPEDYVYRLDYRSHLKTDREDYLQFFEDAGWEHVGEMSGWQYFRKPASAGGGLDIFTDPESKIDKYRRLLGFLLILLLPLIISFKNLLTLPYSWSFIMKPLISLILILYVYACIKIFLRIRQLRRI